MNAGERDELIVQFKLIQLRDNNFCINDIGLLSSIKLFNEYKNLPTGLDINTVVNYSDAQLISLASQCGISKAGPRSKADTIINGEPISLKSNKNAPPALVNHTTRPGFEFAGNHAGGDIDKLDVIIEKYWEKRVQKLIGEDVKNSDVHSPFKGEKESIRPFLNYFLFDGTGSGLSKRPANRILGFTNPLDINTWHIYDKVNAIDMYWDKLIFSLRAKKGMPTNYPNVTSKKIIPLKSSIEKWTKYIDGDYRGALHIRTK
jgi:hypothetical protein